MRRVVRAPARNTKSHRAAHIKAPAACWRWRWCRRGRQRGRFGAMPARASLAHVRAAWGYGDWRRHCHSDYKWPHFSMLMIRTISSSHCGAIAANVVGPKLSCAGGGRGAQISDSHARLAPVAVFYSCYVHASPHPTSHAAKGTSHRDAAADETPLCPQLGSGAPN